MGKLVDDTEFYLKTPQEMSRYELAELEADMREMVENGEQDDNDLTTADLQALKESPFAIKMH